MFVPVDANGQEIAGTSDAQTIRFGTNGAGMTAEYARCQEVWLAQGEYGYITDSPMRGYLLVQESAYTWDCALDAPMADGNANTLADCTAFMQCCIDLYYPQEQAIVQLQLVDAFSPRRTEDVKAGRTSRETGTDIYEGYYCVFFEQVLSGVPLFEPISAYEVQSLNDGSSYSQWEQARPFAKGAESVRNDTRMCFRNDRAYFAMMSLDKIRGVEIEEVPLAPLPDVIASIESEIEAGRIREVTALRLGYVIYSDPYTTEYAWAVPHWVADCMFFETAEAVQNETFHAQNPTFTGEWEFAQIPINAQTAEMIIYGVGAQEIFALPKMVMWEEIR